MAYFCAVLARQADGGWRGRDTDPESARKFSELGDLLREQADGDEPVLLLVEHEDEWFAVMRADGLDDARVFVSEAAAAQESRIGELLLGERPEDDDSDGVYGDVDLLDDLGTSGDVLISLARQGALPADALTRIADGAGCAELLDELR